MNAIVATVIFGLLLLALMLASLRLVIGPSAADRVVALEVIASIMIGMLATYAVFYRVPQALDVAMVLALTGFLAAIGVSRYLVQRVVQDEREAADKEKK
ncbi:MAG: monovalent cation/H+ antiporter complex subunit F [Polycyclovorans sp.]|jgi:multicomponent Na+:H+ antiporter subunit F|nr:pH regulation protein F [Gammaproteobacteria bacterium]MDP1544162.1 monovalent cation/H+ antiporter complex subunit F [Polycyclovorans sp.]MEC8849620.1 monovalent cation/H+ antiporter complex subunit F [Pseudomonadota bacterium]|tara:strand:+ start:3521 stop:3820 length:300 start_codon:yes stop_codon:yes gene_type:complete